MSDIVVTVPKNFRYGNAAPGLAAWLSEGDAPGEPWSGDLYEFGTWGFCPDIRPGERVYVVCSGRIVGYAPLVALEFDGQVIGPRQPIPQKRQGRIILVRGGGAVASTIPQPVTGFRGWRRRWWDRAVERPIDLSEFTRPQE